jgi:hypothetical protein
VDYAVSLSAVLALVGVWLGSLLSARSVDRAARREEAYRWRDMRRACYGAFIGSVRDLQAYVTGTDSQVTITLSPADGKLVPSFDASGLLHRQRLDACYADVQLLARDDEVIRAATILYRLVYRLVIARGVYGRVIPDEVSDPLWEAEREFINISRRDLTLSPLAGELFPAAAHLDGLDERLRRDYEASTAPV